MSKKKDSLDGQLIGVAVAMAVAGIGILAPGLQDAIIGAANSLLQLGLDLSVPQWVGWILLVGGIAFGLLIYSSAQGWIRSKHKQSFAVTHTSFPTQSPVLNREVITSGRDVVVTRICDLSAYFSGGLDVAGALRQQMMMVGDVRSAQRAGNEICYGGLVHIPLQFQFGSAISTGSAIRFFEKDRSENVWLELENEAPPLGVSTNWRQPDSPLSALVCVSVSYLVEESAITSMIEGEAVVVHLSLPSPAIDCVTAYSHLDEIASEFRRVMDRLQAILPATAKVHVMYAGPSSLGVALGRQISHSVHNATWVYNYSRRNDPPYSWAVLVNSEVPEVQYGRGACDV